MDISLFNKDVKNAMSELLPTMRKMIMEEANKRQFNEKQSVDFLLSCAVNLLGNLTLQTSNYDVEKMKNMAAISIKNMITWFEVFITIEHAKKELH